MGVYRVGETALVQPGATASMILLIGDRGIHRQTAPILGGVEQVSIPPLVFTLEARIDTSAAR